jgi:hypothetical protein
MEPEVGLGQVSILENINLIQKCMLSKTTLSYGRLQAEIKRLRETSHPGPWPKRPTKLIELPQPPQNPIPRTHIPGLATFDTSRQVHHSVGPLHQTAPKIMQTSTIGAGSSSRGGTMASNHTRYVRLFPAIVLG